MPVVARGYDASWSPPDPACMKNNGYTFACRYSSGDPTKNLTRAEKDKLLSLGMSVVVVQQEGKTQTSRGYSGGQEDARAGDAFVAGLGMAGMPVYFSCDQDFEIMTSSQKSTVDSYFDGVKSVLGKARAGGYGDDSFCKRQLDAGRITYAWQCRSWSEGMWEARAQLRQVKYDYARCGGTIDDDEAWATDFGQFPRPGGGTATTAGAFLASLAFDGSGRPWRAGIWHDGKVNVLPPGGRWYAVDHSQTGAKGGPGIAIAGQRVLVTYLNAGGEMCTYESAVDAAVEPVKWAWSNQGGDFTS